MPYLLLTVHELANGLPTTYQHVLPAIHHLSTTMDVPQATQVASTRARLEAGSGAGSAEAGT